VKRRSSPLLVPMILAAACGRDTPVEPPAPVSADVAALTAAVPPRVVSPLEVQDMLDDPLFQAAVEGIAESTESSLGESLSTGLSALKAGELATARPLLAKVSAAASALTRKQDADATALMWWSVVERYLEAATLLSPAANSSSENAP
jgi:hypothetical protein